MESNISRNGILEKIKTTYFLPTILILITLSIQKNAQDPINPIKLWVLGFAACWALANNRLLRDISKKNLKDISKNNLKGTGRFIYCCLVSSFVVFLFFAFLSSEVKTVSAIGDTGRNLGFLNYLFLALIGLYSVSNFHFHHIIDIYRAAIFISSVLSIYGLFQHFNLDFINWHNSYNPLILTVGNPDFSASLLSLFLVLMVAGIFFEKSNIIKLLSILPIIFTSIDIYWTQARQGIITSAIGLAVVTFICIRQKSKSISLLFFGLVTPLGVISILGTLQIGPLSSILYKSSINDRGYDWRAAIAMWKQHPFFGVGLDRYGSYFLQYESPRYPLIYGYTQSVNNAHNVFLQFFATAGIFVGISYIALILFVGWRALVALRSSSEREQIALAGLVAGWVVYVSQSVISVDVLSISIWGWIFGAGIVALSMNREVPSKKILEREKPVKFYLSNRKSKPILLSLCLVPLIVVFTSMYQNEVGLKNFLNKSFPLSQNERAAYAKQANDIFHQFLLNPNYKIQIAIALAKNNYVPETITSFQEIIKEDPKCVNAYSLLATVYENLHDYRSAIVLRKTLILLEPYGAINLLALEKDYVAIGDVELAQKIRNEIEVIAPKTDVSTQAGSLLS